VGRKKNRYAPCSLGLSATSQQYFSLRTNQPPATSQNQPAVLFSQSKPAPAISHQPTEQADDLIDFSVGGRLAVNYCFTGFGNSCTIFQQLFSADKCENSYVLDLSLCFCSVECVTCSIAAERLCQGFSVVLQIGNAIIIYMHSGPIKLAGQLVCIYNH
jgi:hypothetical protein